MRTSKICRMLAMLIVTGLLLLAGDIVQAGPKVTHTWTGKGANNNWNNPDNWDTGKVPGVAANGTQGDHVVLPPKDDNYTVNLDIDIVVGNLTIGGDNAGDKKVTLKTNGHTIISKKCIVKASGTLDQGTGNMQIGLSLEVNGTFSWQGGRIVQLSTSLGITVGAGGLWAMSGAAPMRFVGGTFQNLNHL